MSTRPENIPTADLEAALIEAADITMEWPKTLLIYQRIEEELYRRKNKHNALDRARSLLEENQLHL